MAVRHRRLICALRVWPYPPAADEMRATDPDPLVHWAWSCRCGKHGDSYETRDRANTAALRHLAKQGPEEE